MDKALTSASKLDYLLNNHISASDVTRAFGFKSNTMVSNMRKGKTNIATLHLEGLEKHFNIPMELFSYKISNIEELENTLKTYQNKKANQENQNIHSFFKKDKELIEILKGRWYTYMYPSNPNSATKTEGIWIKEITINTDYSVIDEYNNKAILQIGDNQSLILKKSYDHHDISIIRFQNRQVCYGSFRFIILSTQNGYENEMVNFGFFSRNQYSPAEAKNILGDISKVQLKLDVEFNDRLMREITVT